METATGPIPESCSYCGVGRWMPTCSNRQTQYQDRHLGSMDDDSGQSMLDASLY